MKKPSLFLYLPFFAIVQLNAADDEGSDFIKMARAISPTHYNLYLAAKIGNEEFLAVYEPTDEEPRMKEGREKIAAYDAWLKRQYKRDSQLDPSDPKPEDGKTYYDLFKAKVGYKDKLEDVPRVKVERTRSCEEEIRFLDKILYLPGSSNCRPMFLPVDPKNGPALLKSKVANLDPSEKDDFEKTFKKLTREERYEALYEKLALTMFVLRKKELM